MPLFCFDIDGNAVSIDVAGQLISQRNVTGAVEFIWRGRSALWGYNYVYVEVVNKWHWGFEKKLVCSLIANYTARVSHIGGPNVDGVTHSDCECSFNVVYLEVVCIHYSNSECVRSFFRDRRLDA